MFTFFACCDVIDLLLSHWLQNCKLSPTVADSIIHTYNATKLDGFVTSVSAECIGFRTGQNCRQIFFKYFQIFRRRQSWVVANSTHSANADETWRFDLTWEEVRGRESIVTSDTEVQGRDNKYRFAYLLLPSICAFTEENVKTVNDLGMCQEDKPQTHRTVCEISRETGFIGHLCPRLFVRTCVWNVSGGAVHRSWQTRTALLA